MLFLIAYDMHDGFLLAWMPGDVLVQWLATSCLITSCQLVGISSYILSSPNLVAFCPWSRIKWCETDVDLLKYR